MERLRVDDEKCEEGGQVSVVCGRGGGPGGGGGKEEMSNKVGR